MDSPGLTTKLTPPLRRRNSIATPVVVPAKLILPPKPHHAASFPSGGTTTIAAPSSSASSFCSSGQSFSAVDFEMICIKPLSYTSLKDLLPSTVAVHSPSAGSEISIRNRLVKQAAWAYLRPMSTSPDATGHRFWSKFSGNSFIRFLSRTITQFFDRLLRAITSLSFRQRRM
ncbi:hypothetical protein NMG60_11008609 [Bertholletia excelsa]